MQKRRNSIANALELHLFCIKPLKSNASGTSFHLNDNFCDIFLNKTSEFEMIYIEYHPIVLHIDL